MLRFTAINRDSQASAFAALQSKFEEQLAVVPLVLGHKNLEMHSLGHDQPRIALTVMIPRMVMASEPSK